MLSRAAVLFAALLFAADPLVSGARAQPAPVPAAKAPAKPAPTPAPITAVATL